MRGGPMAQPRCYPMCENFCGQKRADSNFAAAYFQLCIFNPFKNCLLKAPWAF